MIPDAAADRHDHRSAVRTAKGTAGTGPYQERPDRCPDLLAHEGAAALQPALEGEDVVLAVAAVTTERANRHQTTAGCQAAKAGQRDSQRVGGLGRAEHANVFHDSS